MSGSSLHGQALAPRSRRRSVVAAIAFFASLVAQFGIVGHMGLVPHEICADHGELVERDADAPAAPAAPHSLPAGEDEHCPLAANPGRAPTPVLALIDVGVLPPVCLEALPATVTPPTASQTSLALLAVAPKTSPPA